MQGGHSISALFWAPEKAGVRQPILILSPFVWGSPRMKVYNGANVWNPLRRGHKTQIEWMGADAATMEEFWLKYGHLHLLDRESMFHFFFWMKHTPPSGSGAFVSRSTDCSEIAWLNSIGGMWSKDLWNPKYAAHIFKVTVTVDMLGNIVRICPLASGTSADVLIWDGYGPSRTRGDFFDFEVGGHDGAYKGRVHVIVPFIDDG